MRNPDHGAVWKLKRRTDCAAFTGVIVAQVLTCDQHPNADKLHVCTVDIGKGEPVQIVCGAPNVKAGVKVPCATIGAVLPGDFKIKKPNSAVSRAMVCSAPAES